MNMSVDGAFIYFTIPIFGGINITQTTVSHLIVTILLCWLSVYLGKNLKKRPDGKHDPLQRWRAATLRRLGQRVEIPWSKDDVERLLRECEEEIKRNTADR